MRPISCPATLAAMLAAALIVGCAAPAASAAPTSVPTLTATAPPAATDTLQPDPTPTPPPSRTPQPAIRPTTARLVPPDAHVDEDEIDYRVLVPGEVGTIWLFSALLPSENGDPVHIIEIRGDLAPSSIRWLSYEMLCDSDEVHHLLWTFGKVGIDPPLILPATMRCTNRTQEPIRAGDIHYLQIEADPGKESVIYTIRMTMSNYSP